MFNHMKQCDCSKRIFITIFEENKCVLEMDIQSLI
ncbi:hypothetical protein AGR7B_Lc160040 [Agrobacterium deltaense RV3]|nr:hypothetical protein AGR7B_Lc160040 [Agrobacterium deltaense RV3]